jgi:hypothetical protein
MNASSPASGVVGRIARLPDLPFAEIKSLWQQLFATPMPTHNRNYLERRIAYRWQELEFAGRQPEVLERNRARIDALIERTKPKAKAGRGERVTLVPGTVLTRDFAGATHRVVAMPDGQFEYRGKSYRSLTAISNEISGCRWSGPAFFGLRQSGKEERR